MANDDTLHDVEDGTLNRRDLLKLGTAVSAANLLGLGTSEAAHAAPALLSGKGEDIALDEVEAEISAVAPVDEPLVKQDLLALPLREAREQFERSYLQQQLVLCNGKVGLLAKRVGMERTHLYRKLRSLGVDFKSVGSDD